MKSNYDFILTSNSYKKNKMDLPDRSEYICNISFSFLSSMVYSYND